MMKNKPINVFLLDDEFPVIDEYREEGVYNGPINSEQLYHLAITGEWRHLLDMQQLIKDIVTSQASKEGLINLIGFTSPLQAMPIIEEGILPDVIIYDWEYGLSAIGNQSKNWLIELLEKTKSFVFVYTKRRYELPPFLNSNELRTHSSRFQLFLKGSKHHSLFSSEEFILQYIIGSATNSGKIKIDGFEVEFTTNDYLSKASDILYLERIFGRKYVLEEIRKVDFSINTAAVEKILNDSNETLLYNEEKKVLISPDNLSMREKLKPLKEVSYLDVVKRFSLSKLQEVLERGISII